MGKYDKLEEIHKKVHRYPIHLHPDERRDYTDEELGNIKHRDFETRMFITNTPVAGDSVFLSTHHTDNAKHASHFNYVRDYLKATHSTKNWTCAKATLTTLLTMCFQLGQSDYCTFAISMASGLSRNAQNSLFEIHNQLVKSEAEVQTVRWKFCLLMDVIFNKMTTKKFLLDDKSCNIFRLVYCDTKYDKMKPTLFVAFFSFTLQICLTLYVILQNIATPQAEYFDELSMLPLAIFTFTYSFMVAVPTIQDSRQAYEILFKEYSILQMMDAIVNVLIPLLLAVSGFLVILCQNNFIDAVLNVTALLFIPEIDDQLPQILGLQEDDIIRNFLIAQSLKDFDQILQMHDSDLNQVTLKKRKVVCRLQFGDFYITNLSEQGIDAQHGQAFQPYQVTTSEHDNGHQIDPSTVVTSSCLLKRIEWNYTTGFPKTTARRVGRLQLTKINGEVVEIVRKEDPTGLVGINEQVHSLQGVFIITTFQMSEDVIKLRVCGSYDPINFIKAFEYYSLWDLTDGAKEDIEALAQRNDMAKNDDLSVVTEATEFTTGGYSVTDPPVKEELVPLMESAPDRARGVDESSTANTLSKRSKRRKKLKHSSSSQTSLFSGSETSNMSRMKKTKKKMKKIVHNVIPLLKHSDKRKSLKSSKSTRLER